MKIKNIELSDEIRDLDLDDVDMLVESESGYTYIIAVTIPVYLADEIAQEKINFIRSRSPMILVKKLTKQIIEEAILTYAEDDAYRLKLCQFSHVIDISIFNQLEKKHQEEWDLFELEGLERLFYHIQAYIGIPMKNRVLFEPMLFLTLFSLLIYCVLKPELLDFFSNFS